MYFAFPSEIYSYSFYFLFEEIKKGSSKTISLLSRILSMNSLTGFLSASFIPLVMVMTGAKQLSKNFLSMNLLS
jgi:hypothetical protein